MDDPDDLDQPPILTTYAATRDQLDNVRITGLTEDKLFLTVEDMNGHPFVIGLQRALISRLVQELKFHNLTEKDVTKLNLRVTYNYLKNPIWEPYLRHPTPKGQGQ